MPIYTPKTNTYYVKQDGSNSNSPGLELFPFATIQHAISQASSGGLIIVLDSSTYTEDITIDKNITLLFEGATIDGIVTVSSNVEAKIAGYKITDLVATDSTTNIILGSEVEITGSLSENGAFIKRADKTSGSITVGFSPNVDFVVVEGEDHTSTINEALQFARTQKKGLFFTSGTFQISSSIIYDTGDYISGTSNTVIKHMPGTAFDMFKSFDFDNLTLTGNDGGVHDVLIENLKLDGNKDNVTPLYPVDGSNDTQEYSNRSAIIKKYGYNCRFRNLQIINASEIGIYCEWTRSAPTPEFPKDDFYDFISVREYQFIGWVYRGVSDSFAQFMQVHSHRNPLHHMAIESRDDTVNGSGGAAIYDGSSLKLDVHTYGGSRSHGVVIRGDGAIRPAVHGRIQSEGSPNVGSYAVYLNADKCAELTLIMYFAQNGVKIVGSGNKINAMNVLSGVTGANPSGIIGSLVTIGDDSFSSSVPLSSNTNFFANRNQVNVSSHNAEYVVDIVNSSGNNTIYGSANANLDDQPNFSVVNNTPNTNDHIKVMYDTWQPSTSTAAHDVYEFNYDQGSGQGFDPTTPKEITTSSNTAFTVKKGDGSFVFNVNTNSNIFEMVNATDIKSFSDNFATEVFKLTGSTGKMETQSDFEVLDSNNGLILKSPNGTRYRIKVDDSGTITSTLA